MPIAYNDPRVSGYEDPAVAYSTVQRVVIGAPVNGRITALAKYSCTGSTHTLTRGVGKDPTDIGVGASGGQSIQVFADPFVESIKVKYFKQSLGSYCNPSTNPPPAEYSVGQEVEFYSAPNAASGTLIGTVLYYHVNGPLVDSDDQPLITADTGQTLGTVPGPISTSVPNYQFLRENCFSGPHSHIEVSKNGARLPWECSLSSDNVVAGNGLYVFELLNPTEAGAPNPNPPIPVQTYTLQEIWAVVRNLLSFLGPPW